MSFRVSAWLGVQAGGCSPTESNPSPIFRLIPNHYMPLIEDEGLILFGKEQGETCFSHVREHGLKCEDVLQLPTHRSKKSTRIAQASWWSKKL